MDGHVRDIISFFINITHLPPSVDPSNNEHVEGYLMTMKLTLTYSISRILSMMITTPLLISSLMSNSAINFLGAIIVGQLVLLKNIATLSRCPRVI